MHTNHSAKFYKNFLKKRSHNILVTCINTSGLKGGLIEMKSENRIYGKCKDSENFSPSDTQSSEAVFGQVENVEELLTKYGTYNIQPTADSYNKFPCIAQGMTKTKMDDFNAVRKQKFSK